MAKYLVTGSNKSGKAVKVEIEARSAQSAMDEALGMGIEAEGVTLAGNASTAETAGNPSSLNSTMRLILIAVIGLCFVGGFIQAHREDSGMMVGFIRGVVLSIIPGLLLGLLYVKRVF